MQADEFIIRKAAALTGNNFYVNVISRDYDFIALSGESVQRVLIPGFNHVYEVKKQNVLAHFDSSVAGLFWAYCLSDCDDIEARFVRIGFDRASNAVKSLRVGNLTPENLKMHFLHNLGNSTFKNLQHQVPIVVKEIRRLKRLYSANHESIISQHPGAVFEESKCSMMDIFLNEINPVNGKLRRQMLKDRVQRRLDLSSNTISTSESFSQNSETRE